MASTPIHSAHSGIEEKVQDSESAVSDLAAPPPSETWQEPRINTFRLLSTYLAFLVYGINDSTPGALLPSIEGYYALNYTTVSLIFLAPAVGCVTAAFLTNRLHSMVGRRGIGVLSCGSYTIAYAIISLHPPFPVVFILYVLTGFGSGLMNGSWNSFVGGLANSSSLLGFLHGFFGVGATISPIIASKFVASGIPWYKYYYLLTGISGLSTVVITTAFWNETGQVYIKQHADPSGKLNGRTFGVAKNKVTILLSVFMLLYLGCELSIGGWIVTFMMRARGGELFNSGIVASGFWTGLTLGRFALGGITGHFGENLMIAVYLTIAIGLQLCFWLIPQFIVSAVMVALVGFFIGMPIPAAIVVATKVLPPEQHVMVIGFSTALAVSGSAILPFTVGALAQAKGVQVLQPVILGLLAAQLGLWYFVPRAKKEREDANV